MKRCNQTDQSEVQMIMQRALAKSSVDQHILPEKPVWRGSRSFDHDSSHASLQQQLLVNTILYIHSFSVSDPAILDNHSHRTSRPEPSFGHIQLTMGKRANKDWRCARSGPVPCQWSLRRLVAKSLRLNLKGSAVSVGLGVDAGNEDNFV